MKITSKCASQRRLTERLSRRHFLITTTIATALLSGGCAYNEGLGPNELLFVSSNEMARLARPVWNDLLRQETVSKQTDQLDRVSRIGSKIINASRNEPNEWEVAVFDSDAVNAVALPNKKMAIYSGLFELTPTDDHLAAVFALLIAHINYNHYGERYSQSPLADNGLTPAQILNSGKTHRHIVDGLFGVNQSPEHLIPFSREHELNADKYAVRYVARAGYDPEKALAFWEEISAMAADRQIALLSVHPVDETRIKRMREEIRLLRN